MEYNACRIFDKYEFEPADGLDISGLDNVVIISTLTNVTLQYFKQKCVLHFKTLR